MRTSLLWPLVGALASFACGSHGSAGEDASPSDDVVSFQQQALHQFTVAEATVTFSEIHVGDNETAIIMQEVGPSHQPLLRTRLHAHFGRLTLLETFYALAPVELEPAPQLITQHALEVARIGRPDDKVKRLRLDLDALTDKVTVGECYDQSFPPLSDDYYWNGIGNVPLAVDLS